MKRSHLFFRYALLFLFLVAYIGFAFYFKLFSYQTIECRYEGHTCSEPIIAELNKAKGSSFFSPTLNNSLEKIKKSSPQVSEILIYKSFPQKVLVEIHEQPVVLSIVCPNTQFGINAQGQLHESQVLDEQLPHLSATEQVCAELVKKQKIDIAIQTQLISFLEEVKTSFSDHQVSWETLETIVLTNSQQQRVTISIDKLSYQLHIYQLLSSQQQLPEQWKSLDLRFQKAVVHIQ